MPTLKLLPTSKQLETREETHDLDTVAPPQKGRTEEDDREEQEPWLTDSWEEFATMTMSTMEQKKS